MSLNLVQIGPRPFENTDVGIWLPHKTDEKVYLVINNSAAHFQKVLKFGRLADPLEGKMLKLHFRLCAK